MSACDIFMDTNLVLHFQPIDQIDWPSLAGFDRCTLVVAPILLRELEQKKIFSSSATLKARAGRTIDFLVEKMTQHDPILLRPDVVLAFAEHEPAIDFAAYQLVREVNDDHYIAAAIERHATAGRKTLIASNDGGLAMKLRSRPIDILRLPDELRLPAEVDAEQKELRDLKRKVAQLESRQPKLSVTFPDGQRRHEINNPRTMSLDAPGLDQIRAEHRSLPLPSESPSSASAPLTGLRAGLGAGNRQRIEEYNDALTRYYENYQSYLAELRTWTEVLRLTDDLAFTLHNEGSATATNIDVTIRFPETILLMSTRDRQEAPEAPAPPARPGTFGALNSYFTGGARRSFLDYHVPDLAFYDGAAYLDEDDPHTVQFSAKSLKQKCQLGLDAILLTRHPDLTGKGVEVDITITCHEGEPIHQKLALTFSETDDTHSDT